MTTQGRGRLPIVDGLRAVAVVAVVLFHGFPALVPGGFIGVDVFFVISGFVIALNYLQPMADGAIRARDFFARRVRRLVPAYLVLLIAVSAAAALLLNPRDLVNFGTSLAAQALYAQNIAFWQIGDYFTKPLTKPLLHTWSLAVEEQFYLFFPLVAWALGWRPRATWVLLALAAFATLAAGFVLGPISPKTTFYWLPFRAWEFLAGIVAARLFAAGALDRRLTRGVTGDALVLAGTAAIVVACFAWGERTVFPGGQSILAVVGTAAVCLGQAGAGARVTALFAHPLPQRWGRISYSWYLWHWPPIVFFFVATGREPGWAAAAALTGLGYALGAWSYDRIERGGLKAPRLASGRGAAALLAGFLLFAAVTGVGLVASHGLLLRYPTNERALLAAQMEHTVNRCGILRRARSYSEEICRLNDVAGPGGILLIGDSHADMAKAQLAARAQAARIPFYLVKQNCRIVDYGRDGNCPMSGWRAVTRSIERHGITTVLAISHWTRPFQLGEFDDAFARLAALPVRVVLERSLPEGPAFDPGERVGTGWSGASGSGVSAAAFLATRRQRDAVFDAFARAHPRVTLLDPAPWLCGTGECRFAVQGRPLFRDQDHLTQFGLSRLGPMYDPLFAR